MPAISMKELLEAGVHFGHQTKRWNPKMKEYIFGERNGIYIIDLQKTLKMFKDAARFVGEMAAQGKNVLFVGTKRQAQEAIAEEATRCAMYYVNQRWLSRPRRAPRVCGISSFPRRAWRRADESRLRAPVRNHGTGGAIWRRKCSTARRRIPETWKSSFATVRPSNAGSGSSPSWPARFDRASR